MSYDHRIRSDMKAQKRESESRPAGEIGFYLVASNRELLNHVDQLMNRQGIFGVMDASGRVHYLIDARRGSPYAARKVIAEADRLAEHRKLRDFELHSDLRRTVEAVIAPFNFNIHLRGYRLLVDMLEMIAIDISLLNPISKRMYPVIAEKYKLTPYQVERNVRYLLDDLARRERLARSCGDHAGSSFLLPSGESRLPVARTVSRLSERVAEELKDRRARRGENREELI